MKQRIRYIIAFWIFGVLSAVLGDIAGYRIGYFTGVGEAFGWLN